MAGRFVTYNVASTCIYLEIEDGATGHRVPVFHYLTMDAEPVVEQYCHLRSVFVLSTIATSLKFTCYIACTTLWGCQAT